MTDIVRALVLGTAQDGGVPQPGCDCLNCAAARAIPERRRLVACLGLVDAKARRTWIIDATPDLPEQYDLLRGNAPGCAFSGFILTHAHIGHYAGLVHLGREAMGARHVPVLCTARMASFLRGNAPWSNLLTRGNIDIITLEPDRPCNLSEDLAVIPVAVPHRDELSDTVAFIIEGPNRRLFYCPDIDSWDEWDRDIREVVEGVDVALLDGTFNGPDELIGRDMAEVPHPPVVDTRARLAGVAVEVHLVHMNHTNPLLGASETINDGTSIPL